MRVLVTGANGMLGLDLCALLEAQGHQVARTDVGAREGMAVPAWETLDITDPASVHACLERHRPDAVVHTAAYTDVDGCERSPDKAYRLNAQGTWNLAARCGRLDIPLVYVSTDFVFDGEKGEPYTEFDATRPLGHYGASKLAGEKLVAQVCPRHFITRTSWLFGVNGKSFPDTMLRLAATRPELKVVADQVGSPTYTVDLAQTILALLTDEPYGNCYGTYHVCNDGFCSWHQFASKILEMAGFGHVPVLPIGAHEFPTPTRRPAYSVMRRLALEMQGRDNLRPWETALADFLEGRRQRESKSAG